MSLNALQSLPFSETAFSKTGNKAGTDIYTDLNGLQNLKSAARKDAKSALPEVARQFEAVMISMMIKNLRKTGMEDAIFKSQAMDSYRDMYDQQLGMELSKGQGIGLAKSIVEQMQYQSGETNIKSDNIQAVDLRMPERRVFPDYYHSLQQSDSTKSLNSHSDTSLLNTEAKLIRFEQPQDFAQKLLPLAEQTAQRLGVSSEVILSQAALETGWGKHIISDGQQSSFNLFNIKADPAWQGKRMEKVSMEYVHGEAVQQKSSFRAYDSFAQSFNDYANFIQNNPRYKTALQTIEKVEQSLRDESYIKGIHKAGYATDPGYSNKVLRVLNSEPIQNQLLNQIKLASK